MNETLNSSFNDIDEYVINDDEDHKNQVIEIKKIFLQTIKKNRHLISNFFFKKTKRKRFLTKNFSIFKKKFFFTYLYIFFIFIHSQLVLTLNDCIFFFKKNMIALNHKKIKNTNNLLFFKKNLFFSLVINKNYYFYYYYFIEKIDLTKNKLLRKESNLKKSSLSFYKQKSEHYSKKYKCYSLLDTDVPNYLEVDFFTLSFFFFYSQHFFHFCDDFFSFFFFKSYN